MVHRDLAPEVVRGEARPSRDTDRYSTSSTVVLPFMVNHPLEGKQEASIKCMDMAARVKTLWNGSIFIFVRIIKQTDRFREFASNANIYWPLYRNSNCASCLSKSFTVGLNNPSKRVTGLNG